AFLQIFPYTSFICPNSAMFFRKTVVFTTFSQLLPAACRMAVRFFSTCSVCASIPPSIRFPVAGSNATWPEINTNPFALIACEYGPIALGAWVVETTSRVKPLMKPLFFNPDPAKRERDHYCDPDSIGTTRPDASCPCNSDDEL